MGVRFVERGNCEQVKVGKIRARQPQAAGGAAAPFAKGCSAPFRVSRQAVANSRATARSASTRS